MNRITIFVLLVVQSSLVHAQKCISNGNSFGICLPRKMCVEQTPLTREKCGKTGWYCCPLVNEIDWSTNRTSSELDKFPTDCGTTPMYPIHQIVGGYIIQPDEYSWMTSLQYGNGGTFGKCGGSVINSLYVITAAHCVIGEAVDNMGGLTGVRLGSLNQNTMCDYGTSECKHYQLFGVIEKIVHENYREDTNHNLRNDIALLRLDKAIRFGPKIKPICLPFGMQLLPHDVKLTVSGWGNALTFRDKPAKRAVTVPLWNRDQCTNEISADDNQICAGETGKNSCNGDSGGPLMYQFEAKRMVLEGIVSQGYSTCGNQFFPVSFTRVRSFLNWIESKMIMK